MNTYKVHFENRFITISPEPDRLQKYALFHKFYEKEELYKQISSFENDLNVTSLNIYGLEIKHLWKHFRSYFSEIEAAGGLVKHPSGCYLFIERRGKWDLPKGHIERGETPEQCAVREVEEECGIKNHKIVQPLNPSYHTYRFEEVSYLKKTHWFLMSYEGDRVTNPQMKEGITKAEWLMPDSICLIKSHAWLSLSDLINSSLHET
jgi:8-oxo-dGTP pyrophosphatase MutT (NUDIX family)